MYKSYKDKEFEYYNWQLAQKGKEFITLMSGDDPVLKNMIDITKVNVRAIHYKHKDKLKGPPFDFVDFYLMNKQFDQLIQVNHLHKTHSLDLKIKQLEERIEHLESK